jgi:hypothetical protein
MQFHYRAIVVTHKLSSLCTTLFLLLRQSHYDYAAELFSDLCDRRLWNSALKGRFTSRGMLGVHVTLALQCCSQTDLNGRRKILENPAPVSFVVRATTVAFINHNEIEKVWWVPFIAG